MLGACQRLCTLEGGSGALREELSDVLVTPEQPPYQANL